MDESVQGEPEDGQQRTLDPVRPWDRRPAEGEQGPDDSADVAAESPVDTAEGPLRPARPWLRHRSPERGEPPPPSEPDATDEDPGGLRPVRPWLRRPPAVPARSFTAPSNEQEILRTLSLTVGDAAPDAAAGATAEAAADAAVAAPPESKAATRRAVRRSAREAARREAGLREQAERLAAERDDVAREAAEREEALREQAEQLAAEREQIAREATEREAALRAELERQAAAAEAASRQQPAEPDVVPAAEDAAEPEEAHRATTGRVRSAIRWLFEQAPVQTGAEPEAPSTEDEPEWTPDELRALAGQPPVDTSAAATPPPAAQPVAPAEPRRRPRPGPGPAATAPRRRPQPGPGNGAPAPVLARSAETRSDGPGRWRRLRYFPKVRGRVRGGLKLLIMLALVAVTAGLLRVYVVAPYYIPSASMEPTLHGCPGCNNDHVLVDKLSYRSHDIHRGDIVVFNRPSTWLVPEKVLIKRVVAVGGDTLTLQHGRLLVDGQVVDEPYVNKSCPAMTSLAEAPKTGVVTSVRVPENDVFVLGDNRCNSADSRAFGPVPDVSVIGRAFVIIWPWGRIHFL